ncbi:unnamed protein product [Dracunculus medinensis]|uniref:Lebercilin domain-containing protein n=1 Tax=Dracunculus medinensis TaxID=318479 RepID=A0A158Q642_DRAME|nr:unnamed protein product [Dracunculus medinensis]
MQSSKPTKINETVDIDNLRNEIAKIAQKCDESHQKIDILTHQEQGLKKHKIEMDLNANLLKQEIVFKRGIIDRIQIVIMSQKNNIKSLQSCIQLNQMRKVDLERKLNVLIEQNRLTKFNKDSRYQDVLERLKQISARLQNSPWDKNRLNMLNDQFRSLQLEKNDIVAKITSIKETIERSEKAPFKETCVLLAAYALRKRKLLSLLAKDLTEIAKLKSSQNDLFDLSVSSQSIDQAFNQLSSNSEFLQYSSLNPPQNPNTELPETSSGPSTVSETINVDLFTTEIPISKQKKESVISKSDVEQTDAAINLIVIDEQEIVPCQNNNEAVNESMKNIEDAHQIQDECIADISQICEMDEIDRGEEEDEVFNLSSDQKAINKTHNNAIMKTDAAMQKTNDQEMAPEEVKCSLRGTEPFQFNFDGAGGNHSPVNYFKTMGSNLSPSSFDMSALNLNSNGGLDVSVLLNLSAAINGANDDVNEADFLALFDCNSSELNSKAQDIPATFSFNLDGDGDKEINEKSTKNEPFNFFNFD